MYRSPGIAGEYTDAETGFQYLRARYYDPSTGQFITKDPITALTQEAYGYVGGNPLNWTDPLGLCVFCLKAASNVLKFTAIVAAGVALAPSAPLAATVIAIGAAVGATAIDCRESIRRRSIDFGCGFSIATTALGGTAGGLALTIGRGRIKEGKILTEGLLKRMQAISNGASFWASTQAYLPADASTVDCP